MGCQWWSGMTELEDLYSAEEFFFLQINLVCIDCLTEANQVLCICTHFYNFKKNTAISMLFCNDFKRAGFIHMVISVFYFLSVAAYGFLETFHCVFFSGCQWHTSWETACAQLHFQNCTSQTSVVLYIYTPVQMYHHCPGGPGTTFKSKMFHWLHWV